MDCESNIKSYLYCFFHYFFWMCHSSSAVKQLKDVHICAYQVWIKKKNYTVLLFWIDVIFNQFIFTQILFLHQYILVQKQNLCENKFIFYIRLMLDCILYTTSTGSGKIFFVRTLRAPQHCNAILQVFLVLLT